MALSIAGVLLASFAHGFGVMPIDFHADMDVSKLRRCVAGALQGENEPFRLRVMVIVP